MQQSSSRPQQQPQPALDNPGFSQMHHYQQQSNPRQNPQNPPPQSYSKMMGLMNLGGGSSNQNNDLEGSTPFPPTSSATGTALSASGGGTGFSRSGFPFGSSAQPGMPSDAEGMLTNAVCHPLNVFLYEDISVMKCFIKFVNPTQRDIYSHAYVTHSRSWSATSNLLCSLALTGFLSAASASTSVKDWQEGFRALLPNVNISFGQNANQSFSGTSSGEGAGCLTACAPKLRSLHAISYFAREGKSRR